MTVTDLITAARDLYNATGDTFFTDAQLYNWIWQASHELAKKAWLIERKYNASTVAGTQDYQFPTNTIAIKRVTVNGRKIKNITHRYDDAITLSNATVTTMGWPIYYTTFNYTISLRPIPDAVYTLQVFSYSDAQQITAQSTLEVPPLFHFDMVDYLLYRMYFKDKDTQNAQIHAAIWADHVKDAIAYKNRMKRTDSFATVQSEDVLPVTIVGES
jgi:hypothetical protein